MAIKVNGVTVIDDDKSIQNITSISASNISVSNISASNISVSNGTVTAKYFVGDGSSLQNIPGLSAAKTYFFSSN